MTQKCIFKYAMLKFTLLCSVLSYGNPNWINNKLTNHQKNYYLNFRTLFQIKITHSSLKNKPNGMYVNFF